MPGVRRALAFARSRGWRGQRVPSPISGFEASLSTGLQIQSLGLSAGWVGPSQLFPTTLYALQAEYGPGRAGLARVFRRELLGFALSRRRRPDLRRLAPEEREPAHGPGVPSLIHVYDVTFSLGLHYTPPTMNGDVRPYFGFGAAAHVINAEGKLINGTLVERSLDEIAGGLFVNAG
jgi:hypothetical protein